jgi:hypothetical protein
MKKKSKNITCITVIFQNCNASNNEREEEQKNNTELNTITQKLQPPLQRPMQIN